MTPFGKLLVANRGEIALRIFATARRLGLRTVAVCSRVDLDAPHARAADEAVCIGEAAPSASYLSIEAIVAAAKISGADAVHPGYGFLAENAAFARACREAGLVFVGPSADSIAAMGDKALAKRRLAEAGVAGIPGYDGPDQRDETLAAQADALGYPVMIKATAGGGGRGMRTVTRAADFAAALKSARSEAVGAFGRGEVLLERALVGVRHVEVQVFADRHGNAVHLGERDCSVQRRHQKLIEEAPSPAVDPALRERMGEAALAVVRAIGYEGAGTVEFLLDAEGRFHFIEMNTRLQVEHAVTEAITGLDLVEWQLRIAAGEALSSFAMSAAPGGHAIEVRLCAEDPAQGFMPQAGILRLWEPPAGVRVEHALQSGIEISPFYDSMIAKLVAHGPDREAARRRLIVALEGLVALGVPTNRELLLRCLGHPTFAAGAATTGFIDAEAESLLGSGARHPTGDAELDAVGALLLFQGMALDPRHGREGLASHPLAHRLPLPMRLAVDGRPVAATILRTSARRVEVEIDGRRHRFELGAQDASALRFSVEGLHLEARFVRDGDRLWFQHRGRSAAVVDRTRAPPTKAGPSGGDSILRASMTGRVVALAAAAGERVAAGKALVVLEAMKMEHAQAAPRDGTVEKVHVAVGAQVAAGQVLVTLS